MAIALDGSASLQGSSGTSGNVTLTTTAAGEIVVHITLNGPSISVSSVTASGLTFTRRATTSLVIFEEWAAPSSGAQTSLVITVNCSTSSTFLTIIAFGVSGCNTSTPFDANVALPDVGATDPRSITTSNANDMLIYGARSNDATAPSAAAGWTSIASGGFTLSQYKLVSATQTALSVSSGSGSANGAIADALQQAGGGGATRPVKMAGRFGGYAGSSGGFAG